MFNELKELLESLWDFGPVWISGPLLFFGAWTILYLCIK